MIQINLSFEIECFSYFLHAQVDCAVLFANHTSGVSRKCYAREETKGMLPAAMGKYDPVSRSNAGKNPSKATLAIRFNPTTMLPQVEKVTPFALMFVVSQNHVRKIW